MKIIKDIRLYKSELENTDGNSLPEYFAPKTLNNTIHRVVMKLREQEFMLGDFDHLYLNFTTCIEKGTFQLAERTIDKYHPWYRFYDVGIDKETFNRLNSDELNDYVLELTKRALMNCFCDNAVLEQIIINAFDEAILNGENMLVKYKTKRSSKNTAVIYLRYLESMEYSPLLCVYNTDGIEILRKNLPLSKDLSALGEIQISGKRVTVKPRKNAFSKDLTPVSFDITYAGEF